MTGIGDAAAAILRAAAQESSFFPRVGIITAISVRRQDPHSVTPTPVVGIAVLTVAVDGLPYGCGASGAFLAEVTACRDGETVFVGRQVKVENLGGSLIVAYTTHWS